MRFCKGVKLTVLVRLMINFLTIEQRDSLLKMFGAGTEAGRQLRHIFGRSPQEAAKSIIYPAIKTRPPDAPVMQLPPNPSRFKRRYRPKRVEEDGCARSLPLRPSRRPADVITSHFAMVRSPPPPDNGRDMNLEKAKLQEKFEFFDRNVDQPSVEEVRKVLRKTAASVQPTDIESLISDIYDAHRTLESLSSKPTDAIERTKLQNRIQRGMRELELLTNDN
jgi:hypothetical protein